MHRMCETCGKHFIGNNKEMLLSCKINKHNIISVADEWEQSNCSDNSFIFSIKCLSFSGREKLYMFAINNS